MARKRRKSGDADGSRKRTAEERPQVAPSQETRPPDRSETVVFSGRLICAAAAAVVIVIAAGIGFHLESSSGIASVASFVGSETCAGCHQTEAKLWGVSQHKAAMQHASDKTVLADFNDASFDYYGVR